MELYNREHNIFPSLLISYVVIINNFMKDLNHKENQTDNENDVPKDSSLWVEIGCSVFKAQLVRNVTLM